MGNQFKPGDVAVFVGPVKHEDAIGLIRSGDEVTLLEFVPALSMSGLPGWMTDRRHPDGRHLYCQERHLRKRPDDEAQKFRDTLKPCDRQFPAQLDRWLNPLTETVVREGLKGILQPFGFEGAV